MNAQIGHLMPGAQLELPHQFLLGELMHQHESALVHTDHNVQHHTDFNRCDVTFVAVEGAHPRQLVAGLNLHHHQLGPEPVDDVSAEIGETLHLAVQLYHALFLLEDAEDAVFQCHPDAVAEIKNPHTRPLGCV